MYFGILLLYLSGVYECAFGWVYYSEELPRRLGPTHLDPNTYRSHNGQVLVVSLQYSLRVARIYQACLFKNIAAIVM